MADNIAVYSNGGNIGVCSSERIEVRHRSSKTALDSSQDYNTVRMLCRP